MAKLARTKKYSANEKKAYYTGLGCGLAKTFPTGGTQLRKAYEMMSEKEKESFINGYEKGERNVTVQVGMRDPKKWF